MGEVSEYGPWWRTPMGYVIKYDQCGYNGVQCFSTPIDVRGTGFLWNSFVIDFGRVSSFLGKCEYLGSAFPRQEIIEQVRRISILAPAGKYDVTPPGSEVSMPVQRELFA